jgi:hypothetical protein
MVVRLSYYHNVQTDGKLRPPSLKLQHSSEDVPEFPGGTSPDKVTVCSESFVVELAELTASRCFADYETLSSRKILCFLRRS